MKKDIEHLYRLAVGMIIINKNKEVFIAKRIGNITSDYWQMPQGGVDFGESEEVAMYRELEEETGIDKKQVKIIHVSKKYFYYNLPIEFIQKIWSGNYIGQKQRWYLLEFNGFNNDIILDNHKPEFSEWKWENIDNITNLVIDFKKKLYGDLVQEFKQFL